MVSKGKLESILGREISEKLLWAAEVGSFIRQTNTEVFLNLTPHLSVLLGYLSLF